MHRVRRRFLPVLLLLPMTAALMGAASGQETEPGGNPLGLPACKHALEAPGEVRLGAAPVASQAEKTCTSAPEPSERPSATSEPSHSHEPSETAEPTASPTSPQRELKPYANWSGIKGAVIDITIDGVHRHFTALHSPYYETAPADAHVTLTVSARPSDQRREPHSEPVVMGCNIYLIIDGVSKIVRQPHMSYDARHSVTCTYP